jgi:hypothetical protein
VGRHDRDRPVGSGATADADDALRAVRAGVATLPAAVDPTVPALPVPPPPPPPLARAEIAPPTPPPPPNAESLVPNVGRPADAAVAARRARDTRRRLPSPTAPIVTALGCAKIGGREHLLSRRAPPPPPAPPFAMTAVASARASAGAAAAAPKLERCTFGVNDVGFVHVRPGRVKVWTSLAFDVVVFFTPPAESTIDLALLETISSRQEAAFHSKSGSRSCRRCATIWSAFEIEASSFRIHIARTLRATPEPGEPTIAVVVAVEIAAVFVVGPAVIAPVLEL